MSDILLIMGSDSDLSIVEESEKILNEFTVKYETRALSAHRTPSEVQKLIISARNNGVKIVIAYAGLAAHLPGVIASFTTLPVIGVPIDSGSLRGIDAILSISQMPSGIPVATMSIGKAGAINAALYAISILSINNENINKKLDEYRDNMKKSIIEKDKKIRNR